MANERGLLPKARREDLGERQQRLLDRWYQNGESSIEPELFELVRVRLAWNNRCVH